MTCGERLARRRRKPQACAHSPLPLAAKLQRELTVEIEEAQLFQRTILAELSRAPGSGAWLLALPTQPAYSL